MSILDNLDADPELQAFLDEYYNGKSEETIKAEKLALQKLKNNEFIDQLSWARLRKRMSQAELADKIGVKQPVISKIESRKSNPNLRTIIKICDALELRLTVVTNLCPTRSKRVIISPAIPRSNA